MIRSMTAFSRKSLPIREAHWVVEIRSLNHRFFEFSLKTPSFLNSLEGRVRDLVHAEIKRGKVMVNISQESDSKKPKAVSIDESVAKLYINAAQKLKKQYSLEGELTVQELIKVPGIFTAERSSEDPEKYWPGIKRLLKQGLDQALEAKQVEGAKLAKDIDERLAKIQKSVQKIEKLSQGRAKRVFDKLSERMEALLEDKEKDQDRLYREAAILAERSDITEEVVRLRSHIELFGNKIKKKGEVGRELDFLCQEMNREINTMGSKSQLFDIATEVVVVKGEIEKIREQVQNIE